MIAETPLPFLFIHIPKTAGTSVEEALTKAVCGKDSFWELDAKEATRHALPGGVRQARGLPYRVRNYAVQHESVEYFEELGLLDGREVFTVVRNPYDRALSEIIYLLRTDVKAAAIFRGPTWADDLKAYAAYDGMLGHDLRACQVDWLTDRSGNMRCDRIMRFESLAVDWRKLCEDWGIGELALPHVYNIGRKVPWWEYYDQEAAERIARKYSRDFEVLGYDTSLPVSDHTTISARTAWFGHGPPPEPDMLVPNRRTRHGRLELPERAVGTIRLYGCLERMTPEAAHDMLEQCGRLLVPAGEAIIHTLDLEFLTSLLPAGYEEGTPQEAFVRSFVDRFLPEGSPYAPAYVLSHLLLRKDLVFLYDEALLAEVLAEAGFDAERLPESGAGEIVVRARVASAGGDCSTPIPD
jgi:hypothetical protein